MRVGLHLWEIASLGARALDLWEAPMPFLEDIHAATRQRTQLTVLDGTDVLVLEWLRARESLPGLRLHAGRRIPAHAAAVGAVLPAHAEARAQEEVLAGPLTRLSGRTPTDRSDLHTLWAHARRRVTPRATASSTLGRRASPPPYRGGTPGPSRRPVSSSPPARPGPWSWSRRCWPRPVVSDGR